VNGSMDDLFSLSGKWFLVTGGTRGVGKAISVHFARGGASVTANYVRDDSSAEKLKSLADEEGLAIDLLRADLTSPKGLDIVVKFVEGRGVKLAGLVHCAATGVHRSIGELTARHFDWVFSLNIRAFFELVRLLLPWLAEGASIVTVSSAGATRAVPYYSLIGASKAAVESFSRHLGVELAPKGIRVNILSPGNVITDSWKVMPDSEQRLAEAAQRTPLGRLVSREEIAAAAQFLCSDASSGMVGQTLIVDGGASIVA
jgi:NAD(P)-dependent dehydrogenase (short-subunit alcohol dehydrogenase family)